MIMEQQEQEQKQEQKPILVAYCAHPQHPNVKVLMYHLVGTHFFTCLNEGSENGAQQVQLQYYPYNEDSKASLGYAAISAYYDFANRIIRGTT